MIPKILHYVWLSGEDKPPVYQNCLNSWHKHMPEFEYKEWTLKNLPNEVLNHQFVSEAINARKWAYATDYIRVWVLYKYGGIYLDLDVEIIQSLIPFLKYSVFSCVEFNPRTFYKETKKIYDINYSVEGLNIEAAVIGSIKRHKFLKDIISQYDILEFKNELKYLHKIIMPRILSQCAKNYGFKYIPVYQVLKEDIHIFPPDTFSFIYDRDIINHEMKNIFNPIRYAIHLTVHGWYEDAYKRTYQYKFKRFILRIFGKKLISHIKNNYNYFRISLNKDKI